MKFLRLQGVPVCPLLGPSLVRLPLSLILDPSFLLRTRPPQRYTNIDVLYGPKLYVSIYLCKDDSGVTTSIQIPKKSSSKSSVRSRCSKTSLKSNSGSAVSIKNENVIEVILFSKKVIISNHTNYCGHAIFTTQPECKPIQALPDGKVTDDIKQSPKHSRKSSVVSKSSKTSLKSISASKVSIKNDTTTEVM